MMPGGGGRVPPAFAGGAGAAPAASAAVACYLSQAMVRRSLVRVALVAALGCAAGAVPRPAAAEPGEDLTVYVLTFGPGDHPFFKFGHNAIWVQRRGGEGVVFNFGTFNFDSPALIPKFLRGRLTYWLSVGPIEETLYHYQASNRTIEAQELDLTPAERRALYERLVDNARPDKRDYLYDYFWDNCSTRVRDALDGLLAGAVRAAGQGPGAFTLRAHALRMTADLPWQYVGLHLGLGSTTDGPITEWHEAFLPERLRDLLRKVRVERDGEVRPLVKSERVLFAAERVPPPRHPPAALPLFLALGVATGGLLVLAAGPARRRRAARVLLAGAVGLLGLVLGLLGVVLVLLWVATNHKAAHANANILQLAPQALALVVLAVGIARGRATALRRAFLVAASAAALSSVGLIAKLLPGPAQDNLAFVALLLPLWAGMALALRRLAPR